MGYSVFVTINRVAAVQKSKCLIFFFWKNGVLLSDKVNSHAKIWVLFVSLALSLAYSSYISVWHTGVIGEVGYVLDVIPVLVALMESLAQISSSQGSVKPSLQSSFNQAQ